MTKQSKRIFLILLVLLVALVLAILLSKKDTPSVRIETQQGLAQQSPTPTPTPSPGGGGILGTIKSGIKKTIKGTKTIIGGATGGDSGSGGGGIGGGSGLDCSGGQTSGFEYKFICKDGTKILTEESKQLEDAWGTCGRECRGHGGCASYAVSAVCVQAEG